MEELTKEEIKKSELDMLKTFHNFCVKNDLRYYITFGTLLGAVRHKGFIPWDDDIDIFMPRSDYDFLIKHYNENNIKSEVISKETNPEFYCNFAKIIDKNTLAIEEGETFKVGVWIDVFPLEYLINDIKKIKRANMFVAIINELSIRLKCNLFKGTRDRIVSNIKSEKASDNYGLLYRNFGRVGVPILEKEIFEPPVKLEFEGEMVYAPNKYDKLLKMCYGDYKKLPPVENRVSHHKFVCYWKKE